MKLNTLFSCLQNVAFFIFLLITLEDHFEIKNLQIFTASRIESSNGTKMYISFP